MTEQKEIQNAIEEIKNENEHIRIDILGFLKISEISTLSIQLSEKHNYQSQLENDAS